MTRVEDTPNWAVEAKVAEDSYDARLNSFSLFTGGLLASISIALVVVNFYRLVTTTGVEVFALALFGILLTAAILQDSIIPPPSIPTYQRLASAIYLAGEDLNLVTKETRADMRKELDRIKSVITDKRPEFKEGDLVFGVALSVLTKLEEVRKRLGAGLKSGIPKDRLSDIQSSLRATAELMIRFKTINSQEIETLVDSLVANVAPIVIPAPTPLVSQFIGWFGRRSNTQSYGIEVLVALFVSVLVGFVFNANIPETLAVFLAMSAFLFETERRARQKS